MGYTQAKRDPLMEPGKESDGGVIAVAAMRLMDGVEAVDGNRRGGCA